MYEPTKSFLGELAAIKPVWKSYVLALVLVIGVIWFIMDWRYGAMIERRDDQLTGKDETIKKLADEAATKQVASVPEFKLELTPESNCHYANQTVEIDGKLFVDCIFDNVTFSYVGKGDYSFMRSKFLGTIHVTTTYQPARVYLRLNKDFENMSRRGGFTVFKDSDGGQPIPYKEPTMNDPKP